MANDGGWRRAGRWTEAMWPGLASLVELVPEVFGFGADVDVHTTVTFRAVVDAAVPETPALGADLGPVSRPGRTGGLPSTSHFMRTDMQVPHIRSLYRQ